MLKVYISCLASMTSYHRHTSLIVKSYPPLYICKMHFNISPHYLHLLPTYFFQSAIPVVLTHSLQMLTRGVHLPSSLCSVPFCQLPLKRTNTHLKETMEALFRVGTPLIQTALYQG
ncbi:hypothetical protein ILYODFUR_033187 [Ilyodon furcidens]|uniref:Uncharacterized protein n=1 Tax=Ilyodon furcidens TaxID=33524 RepID=A0ABV0U1I9_9TELE